MTEAECKAEIRKFFMELYPACTVIYSYPGNAARPPAPYVVLDFNAADSSQIDEYVDDGILQQTWYMTMPFSAELVAQSKVVHGGGVKKALPSTVVDDLAQSIRFFQSPYAGDKMRLLNISVTATGNPEQIYNSVSGVLRGLGDSRRPMCFIAIACVLNICGDLLLVGGFGMGAAGAANVVFRKEIQAAEDPKAARREKIQLYSEQFATPYMAASRGFVDLVIRPSETRARLLEALELLINKERQPHPRGNMPL